MMRPLQLAPGHWINVDLVSRIVCEGGRWSVDIGETTLELTPEEGQVLAAFLGLADPADAET